MPGFFVGKGLNWEGKRPKNTPSSPNQKNNITLNITKIKYTKHFQIMPFMVQSKTQIASNTHTYRKIVKKILILSSIIIPLQYISTSVCPINSFKYDFLKKSMINLLPEFSIMA